MVTTDIIEKKYIELLSNKLDRFKQVEHDTWVFRCPICGDSRTNTNKRRGYIYKKESRYMYHCFNCGSGMYFSNFLKSLDPILYSEYIKETLVNNGKNIDDTTVEVISNPIGDYNFPMDKKYLTLISDLDDTNPGKQYLYSRNIPKKAFNRVYWTDNFSGLVSDVFLKKYKGKEMPKSGIVFKLYGQDSNTSILNDYVISGYQFRHIEKDCPKNKRFVTVTRDDVSQSVYGVQYVNPRKQIYIVEGPIDSLFIPNSIASINSSLWRLGIDNAIYINDCEPRNKEVCKEVDKCISLGYKTALLPEKYYNMDINDIIDTYGYTTDDIISIIEKNTYSGLEAKLMYSKWRK